MGKVLEYFPKQKKKNNESEREQETKEGLCAEKEKGLWRRLLSG